MQLRRCDVVLLLSCFFLLLLTTTGDYNNTNNYIQYLTCNVLCMNKHSPRIILGHIVIFLIVCGFFCCQSTDKLYFQEMMVAGGGERGRSGSESNDGLIKTQSFTFQLGDIQPDEVPQGFEELWPHNSTATPDCDGQEIDHSLEAVLKDNVAIFRETLELPHRAQATTLHELLRDTLEDLQCTYPKCTSCIQISEVIRGSTHQVLFSLYMVLKYVGDIWAEHKSENFRADKDMDMETLSSQQIGERVLEGLSYMSSRAKEMFDLLDKDSVNTIHQGIEHTNLFSPLTPTSVLPEILEYQSNSKESQNLVHIPPLLRPLRLQAVGKLKPMDIKRLSFHMLPLMVDQDSHRMHQTDNINGDLELGFTEASMSMESNLDAIIRNNGGNNPESRTSEATRLMSASTKSHPVQLRKSLSSKAMLAVPSSPHIHQAMSVEQMVADSSKYDDCNGKMSTSSEAAILLASQPIMHVQTPRIQSATPTPPSSPMVLTGLYMPFFDPTNMEPIAFAMAADDFEDMDTDNSSKPSKPTIYVAPPPSPTSQYRETRQEPLLHPHPPPPAAPVEQKETPVPIPLPPSPPPPPSRSVPIPPPPPPSKCPTTFPPTPPLPPLAPGSAPLPPLSPGAAGSAPPPPPPAMKSLRAKKNTKLKRSSQMGNLYRLLKGKVEGPSLNGKTPQRKKSIGGKSGGNSGQGMADALAEITKRSSYFQQIEEDVKNHSAVILELKSSVSSFHTKDISELTKFHKQVETHLEKLTDESQVLARFEDFPTKKLETIRMAVALYSKLEAMSKTLKGWKVASPVAQQLDKVESYFNKIKEDVDATDRNKDEESKRFKSHNIEIDFSVLVRIKESMVDLSSNCIETALKESKEAKAAGKEANSKAGSLSKMLWRAFQLSFRVYNFAGGQDERADRLTSELAHEIETCQF